MDTVLDWQAAYSFTSASEPVHDDDGASDHNDDGERDYHALLLVLRWETIGERHLTARKGSCPAKKAHSKRMVSVIWANTRLTNLRSLARQSFQGRAHLVARIWVAPMAMATKGAGHPRGLPLTPTAAERTTSPHARVRGQRAHLGCAVTRLSVLRGMWLVAGRTINCASRTWRYG